MLVRPLLLMACLALALITHGLSAHGEEDMLAISKTILVGNDTDRRAAIDTVIARDDPDMVPSLVLLMRIGGAHVETQRALHALTGERLTSWHDAMHYQQAHPEIAPHPSYDDLKLWYWGSIDPRFPTLFDNLDDPNALRIRFEEITWGGNRFDNIPPIDAPDLINAEDADYLFDTDLVFGVEIHGDARAYPLRIMGWHEMLNDTIGDMPVTLAYCTLCGAGILFETAIDDQQQAFVFGSSGLLYRSNKLMFDRQTQSLWNQFTGEPVSGPLAHLGIRLKIRPLTITSWKDWRTRHPQTRVLSLDTGFIRDYDPGVVYRDYFASPDLMFPVLTDQRLLSQKQQIYGIRVAGGAKAWPLSAFEAEPVINDQLGWTNLVLIGDVKTQTVRAYERGAQIFQGDGIELTGPGGAWQITENALLGPNNERLGRIAGHVSYWFAWDGYLGVESELYDIRQTRE